MIMTGRRLDVIPVRGASPVRLQSWEEAVTVTGGIVSVDAVDAGFSLSIAPLSEILPVRRWTDLTPDRLNLLVRRGAGAGEAQVLGRRLPWAVVRCNHDRREPAWCLVSNR